MSYNHRLCDTRSWTLDLGAKPSHVRYQSTCQIWQLRTEHSKQVGCCYYLKQCWLIVSWAMVNKTNFNWILIDIHYCFNGDAFEDVACECLPFFYQRKCVVISYGSMYLAVPDTCDCITIKIIYVLIMITSSNGNIFRVTGHLCGEFTGHRWIPQTKTSDAELWCFL